MQNEGILRRKEVEAVTGLGRSTIYELMAENKFPQQVPLHGRAVGWVSSQVQEWIQSRISESRGVAA